MPAAQIQAVNSPGHRQSPTITTKHRAATCNDVVASESPQHQQGAATLALARDELEEVEEQEDYISTPMSSPARPLQRGKCAGQDTLDTRNDSTDLSVASPGLASPGGFFLM
jgi:hypothetical protein